MYLLWAVTVTKDIAYFISFNPDIEACGYLHYMDGKSEAQRG